MQWQSQLKRRYRVFYTDNLAAWPTTPALDVVGDGTLKSYAQPLNGVPRLFSRITVEVVAP